MPKVQRLQIARRELALEAAIAKLDKFHLLILDDLAYVTKDQAKTSVLFELISARYAGGGAGAAGAATLGALQEAAAAADGGDDAAPSLPS